MFRYLWLNPGPDCFSLAGWVRGLYFCCLWSFLSNGCQKAPGWAEWLGWVEGKSFSRGSGEIGENPGESLSKWTGLKVTVEPAGLHSWHLWWTEPLSGVREGRWHLSQLGAAALLPHRRFSFQFPFNSFSVFPTVSISFFFFPLNLPTIPIILSIFLYFSFPFPLLFLLPT